MSPTTPIASASHNTEHKQKQPTHGHLQHSNQPHCQDRLQLRTFRPRSIQSPVVDDRWPVGTSQSFTLLAPPTNQIVLHLVGQLRRAVATTHATHPVPPSSITTMFGSSPHKAASTSTPSGITRPGIGHSLKRIFSPSVDDEENRLHSHQFKNKNITNGRTDDTSNKVNGNIVQSSTASSVSSTSPMKDTNGSNNSIVNVTKDTTPTRRLSKRNKTNEGSTTTAQPVDVVLSVADKTNKNKNAVLPAIATTSAPNITAQESQSGTSSTSINKPDPDGLIATTASTTMLAEAEKAEMTGENEERVDTTAIKTVHPNKHDDEASDCGTEVSSVSTRREWLVKFGQEHESSTLRKMNPPTAASVVKTTDDKIKIPPEESRDDYRVTVSATRSGGSVPSTPPRANLQRSSTLVTKVVAGGPGLPKPSTPSTANLSSTSTHVRNRTCTPHYTVGATVGGVATTRRVVRNYSPKDLRLQRANMDVQATDEGYASVAKLSQWLASDPTSTKKKKQIRRGANVISKSRQFEKDQEHVIIVENHISRGAVTDKKKWLQNAFRHEESDDGDDVRSEVSSSIISSRYTKSEVGVGRTAPLTSSAMKTRTFTIQNNRQGETAKKHPSAQSEIITDDAASSLSVADKKDWLQNAFKKTTTVGSSSTVGMPPRSYGYSKAKTDIVQDRFELGSGSGSATRAKMRFKERSARKLLNDAGTQMTVQSSLSEDSKQENAAEKEESSILAADNNENSADAVNVSCQEDMTAVDFRAARESLVCRCIQNGQKAEVVNKVNLRKNKFEQMDTENRRKSAVHGPLKKAMWDSASPSSGRPSNVYEKKYVPNIAPKKSFEELP